MPRRELKFHTRGLVGAEIFLTRLSNSGLVCLIFIVCGFSETNNTANGRRNEWIFLTDDEALIWRRLNGKAARGKFAMAASRANPCN